MDEAPPLGQVGALREEGGDAALVEALEIAHEGQVGEGEVSGGEVVLALEQRFERVEDRLQLRDGGRDLGDREREKEGKKFSRGPPDARADTTPRKAQTLVSSVAPRFLAGLSMRSK